MSRRQPMRTVTDRSPRRSPRTTHGPVPHLIRVLDYERPCASSSRHRLDDLDDVILMRGERDQLTRLDRSLTLVMTDSRMSQRHAQMLHRDGQWTITDLGSRNGTFVDGAAATSRPLEDGELIELGRTALLFRMLEPVEPVDVDAEAVVSPFAGVRTFSPRFAALLANLARVSTGRLGVVLQGETGTGKELLARGIHAASGRTGPFVAVNCGALPATLIESELFGYRKGAFSGASEDRAGLVRAADRGTLLFDEVGDLPLPTQAALLRVLQEREVTPVGATQPIAVDVRVIAASHRDLEVEVAAGRFREDLLARLVGHLLVVPPLRDRREDLGILIAALLRRAGAEALTISPEAGYAILRHRWPRNIRELEHLLASATSLAVDGVIGFEQLPASIREPNPSPTKDENLSPLELQRRDDLRRLLAKHRGNIAAVGRELGVARMQIHRWIERYELDIDAYRGP